MGKRLEEGEASFNCLYYDYRRTAFKRGHAFELTKEEVKTLTKQNCFYCNKPPSQVVTAKHSYSSYIYNGIDRKNNKEGYYLNNVVPCCFPCNDIKGAKSLDEFKEHITNIYNNFINPSLENLISDF